MNKLKDIMKIKKVRIAILVAICLLSTLSLEKFYFPLPFSLIRNIVVFFTLLFIGLHFVLDIEKMYHFMYQKRYYIGGSLLAIFVILGLNGSSINAWDAYIQPQYYRTEFQPILGKARGIRSDEWVVNSTIDLSQAKLKQPFSKINNITRGADTSVSLITKSPTKSINILVNPFKIAYIFFGNETGMSFWWFGRLFALFFLSFEMLMVLTDKKKKLSLVGAILITFAPAVQWWYSTPIVDILIYGQAAILIFNGFFQTKTTRNRILLSIAMGIVGACYICCYYPAWQISFGYVYLVIFIWMLYKNRKNLHLKYLLYLLLALIIAGSITGYMLYDSREALQIILNTAYPGKRISTGGVGWNLLFTYFSSFLYSFKDISNPCENSQFFSLFPLPLLIAIYFIIKNRKEKKKDILLCLLTIISVLLLIWNFIELPPFIAKITLLSMSTPQRSQMTIGYIMILMLIHIFSNYTERLKLKKCYSIIISFIFVMVGVAIVDKTIPNYMTAKCTAFIVMIIFLLIYMILNNSKKYAKYIMLILILVTIVPGIAVNPLNQGLDVMYNKPLAQKIQEIVKKDSDSKWVVVSKYYNLPNYFVANGAPTINSVNVYPNLELWEKFDLNNEYEEIYNRYAHIFVSLVDDSSSYEFVESYYDLIRLNLGYEDVKKMGAKYIATDCELPEKMMDMYNFQKIYDEYGMIIYKLEK